ncbi:HTH-type transcriptional regulator SinR [Lactobacillus helveticus]|jgi:transcriptional regulator with XRE-family HTH domain|uniref:helix-turn-helix domain-containing protein n=1 Tax=Lactobacillus TaxID=1578 RepID=UPI001561C2E4|nr:MULTISPECIES: helix-turn-helix transcriptional regulator [Lactobacillus]NRN81613.1 HTH-type transcriptional regulator SinR [Lactobacillus helveticus]NRO25115.1 HTH-type transcriptional regulator SinR [Lactobacillus helveticus]
MNTKDNFIKHKLAIGQAIRYYRKSKKWSQEYLGFKAGLDRTYIGGVERGERNITLRSLTNISDALNINLYTLLEKASNYE